VHRIRIFSNMSVNLIFDVMKSVARLLDQDYVLGLVKKFCCPNFYNKCYTVEVCLVCVYAS